jgi:hypothetical protein
VIDVESTLDALGITGNVYGDELTAACPMHLQRTGREDAHPSWSVNVITGLFNCFSCGYKGSIITLIADIKGVDFDTAKTLTIKPDLVTSLARVPGADIYVPRPAIMSETRLAGFNEPPKWARHRRQLSAAACDLYGVKWDYRNELWITPIRDPYHGHLMGWQEKSETERVFRNYPTNVKKSRSLFGYDVFTGGRLIVVESPLDAVRLASAGVTGAVSTYGAHLSLAQIALMSAAEETIFALDNPFIDPAGKRAALFMLSASKGILRNVRFFDYSQTTAKDPGDMTLTEIEHGIKNAKSRAYGERAIS